MSSRGDTPGCRQGDAGGGAYADDLRRLPFAEGEFDWVWCADALWPTFTTDDPVAAVAEFGRVLKPGGVLGLLYWSSQSLLPGHPGLEARLNAAFAATAPYLAGVPAEHHFMRAASWLRAAGFAGPTARTFVSEFQAPLSAGLRDGLSFCFGMLWGDLRQHISRGDWAAYRRLCSPRSRAGVLADPDYYGFITCTLFRASKPAPSLQ